MINLRIITLSLISTFIICANLYAQYDNGTVIYNQTSSTNLTSIQKNYIVEDLDGDFNADVIMIKHNATNNTNQLTWYKGNANGNFTPQPNIMSIDNTHRLNEIFYEDMNGDGNKDIVFQNSDTGFTILLNDGFGNIIGQLNNTTAGDIVPSYLKEIADLDGDGDMDGIFWAVTDNPWEALNLGYCLIGYNNGTGTFVNYNYLENNEYSTYHQIETGDIDGDGDLDIICNGYLDEFDVIVIGGGLAISPFIRVYENLGSNNYAPKEEINLGVPRLSTFKNIKVEDINADGTDELLIEYSYADNCEDPLHGWGCEAFHQFKVMDYNVQINTFENLELYNTWLHGYNEPSYILLDEGKYYIDFFHIRFGLQNNDSNLDILSINVPQGKLHWYNGDGNGGFSNGQTVNFNNQYSNITPTLRVADIDNDTDLDVFVLLNDGTTSNLTVFKNLALTPSCTSILDLANTSLTDGIYQASTTIISSGDVVAGNNNVVLKAGNNVKLESGFTVPANSTVKVRISSCN